MGNHCAEGNQSANLGDQAAGAEEVGRRRGFRTWAKENVIRFGTRFERIQYNLHRDFDEIGKDV